MSKNNSLKKLNYKAFSPPGKTTKNDNSPIQSISNINNINKQQQQLQSDQPGIIEVYEDNFIEEMKNLSFLLDEYNYVGMDTEFPGTVYSVGNMTEDFYYKTLKINVDKLKLIQLGITLKNEKGEYPKNYPYHTWQFNLEFDKNTEPSHPSSMNLLKQCGIDFDKLKKRGINHKIFAQYFTISNLVLNPDIKWVSFQGAYDFGYLLKLLIGTDLPEKEEEFIDYLNLFFINYYDIRILVKGNDNMQRGLNRLAEQLEVSREGKIHQAGSDSVVTIDVFFKLKKSGYVNDSKLEELKNILYGIGGGRDNDETIIYTQIGGTNYQNNNNNNNNLMFVNMPPLGTNFLNVNLNMNFYNYPMMMNTQNNAMSPLHKNNSNISTII
jgi:CCR4-NOT transcription complex subunit 7/8